MAEIFIYDTIGPDIFSEGVTESAVAEQLTQAGGEDVLVRINSPGGVASIGIAIHSLLTDYSGTVNVKVDGLAASAASIIALAGDTVEMAAGSRIMIHDPWAMTIGDAKDHQQMVQRLDQLGEELAKMYAAVGSKDVAEFRALMKETTWLTADEAIEIGLATKKTETKAKACVVPAEFGYANVPQEFQKCSEKTLGNGQVSAQIRNRKLALAGRMKIS